MGLLQNGRSFAIAAIITLIAAPPAFSASFDCTKAKAPDEKAICANRALSELDVEMATLYSVRMEIPMLMGSRGAARDAQHNWLVQRATCGSDVACLTQSYSRRIGELTKIISTAMHDYCKLQELCG